MSLPNAPSIPLSESHPAYPALILAGFRYCLGRMTHVSSSCASILIETWDKLPADIQATIASEISLALAGNGAGMSSDVESWAAVLSRSAGTEPFNASGLRSQMSRWAKGISIPSAAKRSMASIRVDRVLVMDSSERARSPISPVRPRRSAPAARSPSRAGASWRSRRWAARCGARRS